MFQNIKSRITETEADKIVALAAIDGSPEGVAKEAEKYLSSDNLHFYGWLDDDKILGICGFEIHAEKIEIHGLCVSSVANE